MDHAFVTLVDDGLQTLWERDPVSATFAGETAYDGLLPRVERGAETVASRELEKLADRLAATTIPDTPAARIDARHLGAFCSGAGTEFARRARYRNPAWYTGEATFGVISLLLAASDGSRIEALSARLAAIPDFFAAAGVALRDVPIPAAWVARAHIERQALKRLLVEGLPLHPAGALVNAADVARAVAACDGLAARLRDVEDSSAACGSTQLAAIMRDIHGLSETPAELERRAVAAFSAAREQLETQARRLDATRSWREQLAAVSTAGPAAADVVGEYTRWHARAINDAAELLTPAAEYHLTFELLPAWARTVAGELYFLFYRSPPARTPGAGSRYWVMPPAGTPADIASAHNHAAVKLVHAVHHGSIGHHTQNARARTAGSSFARIAATDGASALALPASGTLAEGWACYAEDLMAEIPGFYSAAEQLQLRYFEYRNIGCCLADLRFHSGAYTLQQMQAFYRDEVGFAPARIEPETTRNSMFPGSRLMYWCGAQQIAQLRRASNLPAKAFHDRLLSFGAAPVAWLAAELAP